jgi:Ca2+-binding RTX toxin-like protein
MANFYGDDTDDRVFGGFVNFYGGDGDDFVQGDAAANALYGGEGNDVLNGSLYLTYVGEGTLASPYVITSFGPSGNDYFEGAAGDDVIYGADGDDALYGGDGNESGVVTGYNGEVEIAGLFGGEGQDYLDGGRGHDLLDGGSGIDTLLGGLGDDTILVDSAADFVIEAEGSGSDTVLASVSYVLRAGAVVEALETNDAAGLLAINLTGNAFSQTITGNAGANVLRGVDGHDRMFGLGGNDRLFGGFGNEIMDGGTGSDILFGERGADDIYTGGADGVRDWVRYTSLLDSGVRSSTRDDVFQFVRSQDKIDLRAIDANLSVAGNQKFHVVSAFTGDTGEVRLARSGAHTILQIDGDRDNAVDMTIRVLNVHLTASDLLL